MARSQFTYTFRNAEPGAQVSFSAAVYASKTAQVAEGPTLVLDSTRTVAVWSDATELTATWVDGTGASIAAEASLAIPVVVETGGTLGTGPDQADAASIAAKAQKLTRTAVKTGNYTAAAGDMVPCDTTSAAFTVTLPNAPAVGSRVVVKIVTLGAGHFVTIACAGSDVFNKTAGGTTASLQLLGHAMNLQYDAGAIWTVVADDVPLSQLNGSYPQAIIPEAYGAVADGVASADGVMATGGSATTLTTSAAIKVGHTVTVAKAGSGGVNLTSTATAVTGPSGGQYTVTLADPCLSSVSAVWVRAGTESGAALVAAFAAAAAAGRNVSLKGLYKCSQALTWNAATHNIDSSGRVDIDQSGIPNGSGPGLTVTGTAGTTNTTSYTSSAGFFRLIGPDNDLTDVDGIYWSDSGGVPGVGLDHVVIRGYRDNETYGTNAWTIDHRSCLFQWAHRRGINFAAGSNSGENQHYYGCVVANSHNAGNTAVGIYTPATNSNVVDAYFYGISLDYNDFEIQHNAGTLNFLGGHIENGDSTKGGYAGNPMIQVASTGGDAKVYLGLDGLTIAPTERKQSNQRDHLIEHTSASTGSVVVDIARITWSTFDWGGTLYKNLSGATPVINFRGYLPDSGSTSADRACCIGQALSQLVSGDFESGGSFKASAAAPWYPGFTWMTDGHSAPAVTWAFDTTHQRSGTQCVSAIGAAGNVNSQSLRSAAAVVPGAQVQYIIWVNVTAYTSGSLVARLMWYYDDYTTRLSVGASATINAATSGYVPLVVKAVVPQGIRVAVVDIQSASFIGTGYIDDAELQVALR